MPLSSPQLAASHGGNPTPLGLGGAHRGISFASDQISSADPGARKGFGRHADSAFSRFFQCLLSCDARIPPWQFPTSLKYNSILAINMTGSRILGIHRCGTLSRAEVRFSIHGDFAGDVVDLACRLPISRDSGNLPTSVPLFFLVLTLLHCREWISYGNPILWPAKVTPRNPCGDDSDHQWCIFREAVHCPSMSKVEFMRKT
jgi:hypothetical protein